MILELKRFKKAADLGAITKASEILFITQPAMTQSIQRLEKELGFKLFKHEGKKVYLTEQGKMVSEIAEKIIVLWENAKNLNDPVNLPTKLTIGVYDSAALMLTDYFNNKLNKIKLGIIIDRSENLLKKLRLGLIDICICVLPTDKYLYSSLKLMSTFKEKLLPVTALNGGKLSGEIPLISYSRDSQTGKYVNESFFKAGIKTKIVTESVNPLFIRELALKNMGTAILPYNMVKDDIDEKRLFIQKLPVKFERTCAIFTSKELDNPVLLDIMREIQEELKKV